MAKDKSTGPVNVAPETTVAIARTHMLAIDTTRFNEAVGQYIYMYGLKQILNDAGSAAKTPEEKLAMAEKKLAAMYEGTVRTAGSRASVDPVQAEAERMAWEVLSKALRASGKKIKDVTDEAKADLIGKYLAKYPETMEKAKEALAAKANVPTVDLTDIL